MYPESYSSLKILSGNSNPKLSQEIADHLGVPLAEACVEKFPDGEIHVQIDENIRGTDVFIVQSTSPPANDHLMELLILIDAAKRASAGRITAVIPFYGYARQDRKSKPRVPITAKLVANLLVASGVNRILTMDLHAQQITGFFDIPIDHLFSSSVIIDHLKGNNFSELAVFAPDVGSVKMASAYAEALGAPFGFVAKRRIDAQTVEAVSVVGEPEGKEVLLVDDMSESGGTLVEAAKLLKAKGATSVKAAVAHGVFNEMAYERLQDGYLDSLITTNSTPVTVRGLPIEVLSVGKLFANAIHSIHQNQSVTDLALVKGY